MLSDIADTDCASRLFHIIIGSTYMLGTGHVMHAGNPTFFGSLVIAGHGLPPITAGIGVWLDGVGQAGMYRTAERMNGGRDCTDAGRAFESTMVRGYRRSTCKDRFKRTRHKMCRHQLNEWAWKNDEKVRWKYQPDRLVYG